MTYHFKSQLNIFKKPLVLEAFFINKMYNKLYNLKKKYKKNIKNIL